MRENTPVSHLTGFMSHSRHVSGREYTTAVLYAASRLRQKRQFLRPLRPHGLLREVIVNAVSAVCDVAYHARV